jgi:hypothetical protein
VLINTRPGDQADNADQSKLEPAGREAYRHRIGRPVRVMLYNHRAFRGYQTMAFGKVVSCWLVPLVARSDTIPSWVGGASGPWDAWEPNLFCTTRVERTAPTPALQRRDMVADRVS